MIIIQNETYEIINKHSDKKINNNTTKQTIPIT